MNDATGSCDSDSAEPGSQFKRAVLIRRRRLVRSGPLAFTAATASVVCLLLTFLFAGRDDSPAGPLRIAVAGPQPGDPGRSVVFPEEQTGSDTRIFGATIDQALEQGSYLVSDSFIRLSFSSESTEEIVVKNIRLVNLSRKETAVGALLYDQPINLVPRQRLLQVKLDEAPSGVLSADGKTPFFPNMRVSVPFKKPLTLPLFFLAKDGSYEFTLAVEYEVWGTPYTQTVSRAAGEPFRFSAALCPPRAVRAALSDSERQRLKSLRYKQVRERSYNREGDRTGISAVDPDAFAESCWE